MPKRLRKSLRNSKPKDSLLSKRLMILRRNRRMLSKKLLRSNNKRSKQRDLPTRKIGKPGLPNTELLNLIEKQRKPRKRLLIKT